MWFRDRADQYRQKRIARTLKIFENTFQSNENKDENQEEKSSCRIL